MKKKATENYAKVNENGTDPIQFMSNLLGITTLHLATSNVRQTSSTFPILNNP